MTSVIDRLEEEWNHLAGRLHHPGPPVNETNTTQGATPTMSSAFEDLQKLLAVADENALRAVNAVLAHPEGAAVLADVAAVAGLPIPPGTLTAAASGLKAILGIVNPQMGQPVQAPQPVASA